MNEKYHYSSSEKCDYRDEMIAILIAEKLFNFAKFLD